MNARFLLVPALVSALSAQSSAVKLPAYTREVLPNGTVLFLVRKPDVPLVTVRALVRGGAEADPAGKEGLASLTAELLRRGTAAHDAAAFSNALDGLGAQWFGGADRQATFLSVEFLSRETDKALGLFEEALIKPAFSEEEFKKAKAQRVDGQRAMKDNPSASIGPYFTAMFYPAGHPYARPLNGDELSLADVSRDDVQSFYKRNFCGRNLVLIAAGDFDPTSMAAKLKKVAAGLPKGEGFAPKAVATSPSGSARLLLVDKPDATQTYFIIGQPGVDRRNPDRVALRLMNTLFGGRFTSMLNEELRVNSGLSYGANSQVDFNRLPGAILISTFTKTETTVQAVDLALTVLHRFRDKGITEEQLASAKAYVKGGFPTSELETADQVATVLGQLELFGLNRDEIDGFFAKIDALTLDQANAIIRKYYSETNLQFTLVGNASKIAEGVKKYAPKMVVHPVKDPGFRPPAF